MAFNFVEDVMRRFATLGFCLLAGLWLTFFQGSGLPGREVSADEASSIMGGTCGNYQSITCTNTACPGEMLTTGNSYCGAVSGGCSGNCTCQAFDSSGCNG